MSKAVKGMLVDELRRRYDGVSSACLVDWTGLSVAQQQEVRTRLRERNGRAQVVKNSAARRAFHGATLQPLGDALSGPCVLVTAAESVIDIAKVLVEAAKELDALKLKEAMFSGEPELVLVADLARMKSQSELLGEVAMLVASPGRGVAGCLTSPQARIAGCLKEIAEKAA